MRFEKVCIHSKFGSDVLIKIVEKKDVSFSITNGSVRNGRHLNDASTQRPVYIILYHVLPLLHLSSGRMKSEVKEYMDRHSIH